MRPEDVIQLLRASHFEPFRIHLSDGASYEVRHPELAIVGRSKMLIAVPGPQGPDGPVEKMLFCALVHITRIEPLNGQLAHGAR